MNFLPAASATAETACSAQLHFETVSVTVVVRVTVTGSQGAVLPRQIPGLGFTAPAALGVTGTAAAGVTAPAGLGAPPPASTAGGTPRPPVAFAAGLGSKVGSVCPILTWAGAGHCPRFFTGTSLLAAHICGTSLGCLEA